jgi:hypothetical protein
MLTLDRVILERRQVMIVSGDRESNAVRVELISRAILPPCGITVNFSTNALTVRLCCALSLRARIGGVFSFS